MIRNKGKLDSEITPVNAEEPYNDGIMAGRPPSKDAPPFGQRLAALRKERGHSSAEFARLAGISEDMLTYYERRATNPSAAFALKAAELLGVTADELLDGAGKPARKPGPPSQLEQRIAALRELPRERQKFVVEMIDTVLRAERSTD
jgi:transcriptional regulator with XRE-family HTH domain